MIKYRNYIFIESIEDLNENTIKACKDCVELLDGDYVYNYGDFDNFPQIYIQNTAFGIYCDYTRVENADGLINSIRADIYEETKLVEKIKSLVQQDYKKEG